ncbi:MAG: hypothetical protein WCK35_17340, partial [Chloroflexota bacterium]
MPFLGWVIISAGEKVFAWWGNLSQVHRTSLSDKWVFWLGDLAGEGVGEGRKRDAPSALGQAQLFVQSKCCFRSLQFCIGSLPSC